MSHSKLSKARTFAINAHGKQKYGVHPYEVHLDAVADLLKPFGDTAMTIGYLHDVIEDTNVTLEQLESEFGGLVAKCVGLLTDEPGADRKGRKIKTYKKLSKVSGAFEVALTVKVADRLANVRACVLDKHERLLEVYRSEYKAFHSAAFRVGKCDELWQELDSLLKLH